MQTTLARRQRRRRSARRPQGRGGSTLRRVLIAIPIILILLAVLLGVAGLLFSVAAYNYYAQGLPEPKAALSNLQFDQQTRVFDRSNEIELARLGSLKREVVTFDQLPGEMLDATTAIEDKDFWTNPGFDPAGIVSAAVDTVSGRPRGASTITQQLVRARLLPPEAFEGSTYERKIREIIQSIRLTEAYPGDAGKQDIITAYLNQNFYGNNLYGVQAAAKGYFGKDLKDLSLAQYAILAGIPQSPTSFDLVKNAEETCLDTPVPEDPDDCKKSELIVPPESAIAQRRDRILELMKTRSPISGSKHTAAEYEAAKSEPIVIVPQVSATWRAPLFVWRVRDELAGILCPDSPNDCPEVDTGGYHVVTTLDWDMQKTTEKYVYAAARAPHASDPRQFLRDHKIPKSEWSWILGLRGSNIHNAAAGVIDYRTGEVYAYVGSANYNSKGNKKFQPKFDVLTQGWRQPGSSIKPIDYAIGIEDETYTAATMFMDVATNFGGGFIPLQADKAERGPVRLRSALQFSLNVPAIKATIMSGIDHTFERTQDFGIRYQGTAIPVLSEGIGTLETHPIDMLSAYGAIANGGKEMPREMIKSIVDAHGKQIWPLPDDKPEGNEVISKQSAYIITDILSGNTVPSTNPYWGKWAIYDGGVRRPAAYKTGTTSDNVDVHAYGYLAPPKDKTAPALAVGVWMGNSNNDPNKGSLSLDSSAPLWSAIMTSVSKGEPIAKFKAPGGLKTATVDAFTGLKPGPFTTKTVRELFLPGTEPKQRETSRIAISVDSASGLLWRDGCVGPKVTRGFFDISEVESNFPAWQKADRAWAARAAKGPGVRGGPKGTHTAYFYDARFRPYGSTWGAPFAPKAECPLAPPPCGVQQPDPDPSDAIPPPTPVPCPTPPPTPSNGGGGGGGGGGGDGGHSPRPTKPPKQP
jgi:membrane peptidoglycan carboxypeptidase